MPLSGFNCQDAYLPKLVKLSDQEVGRLFRALMKYHALGEETELTGRESIAYDFIKDDIDRAEAAYQAKCEKNRHNRVSTNDNDRQRSSTVDDDGQRNVTTGNDEKTATIDIYIDKGDISVNNRDISSENRDISISEKERYREKEARFDRFWAAYPRKTNKDSAKKAFMKLNPTDEMLSMLLSAIEQQESSDQWQDQRFIPHAATWLNGKRWEDKLPAARVKRTQQSAYAQRDYDEDPSAIPDWLQARMQN